MGGKRTLHEQLALVGCGMNDRQLHALDLLLDDHFALWDFADSFPVFRPDAPASAVDDLVALVRSGFVALTYGEWHENRTVPVLPDEVEATLRDPKCWLPKGRQPGHALELTVKGAEHLRRLGIGLPGQ
jgi:hypothetical protein